MATEDDKKLAEYKEAAADVRLHSGMLFGQLTVYLAVNSGLIQALNWSTHRIALATIGMLMAAAFFVIAERLGDHSHAARNRAREIEMHLGFSLYTSTPAPKLKFKFLTGFNATRFIFGVGFAGWMMTAFLS